jgi:hypothetical protein
MEKNKIIAIDLILITVSLLSLVVLIGYVSSLTPLAISPTDGYKTTETEILFSIENADRLLIDDNLEFSSPRTIELAEYGEEDIEISLKPGIYYWKAIGLFKTEIKTLTIESEVNLILEKSEDKESYSVKNAGNIALNVEIYNNTDLIEEVELIVSEDIDASEDKTKFIGSQNE